MPKVTASKQSYPKKNPVNKSPHLFSAIMSVRTFLHVMWGKELDQTKLSPEKASLKKSLGKQIQDACRHMQMSL